MSARKKSNQQEIDLFLEKESLKAYLLDSVHSMFTCQLIFKLCFSQEQVLTQRPSNPSFLNFFVIAMHSALTSESSGRGFEVAKRIGSVSSSDNLTSSSISSRNAIRRLRFRFNSTSHINGWWCVRMFEASPGWDNNYLCTNYDIGLSWHYVSNCDHKNCKCVTTAEPVDGRWRDNKLCLPPTSNIELIWSHCGTVPKQKCIRLYEQGAPSWMNDNYLCWKVH